MNHQDYVYWNTKVCDALPESSNFILSAQFFSFFFNIIFWPIGFQLVTHHTVLCSGKQAKHENFASEVASNEPRIRKNRETAEELVANDHYMSDIISDRAQELESSWEGLREATDKKTKGLNEAMEEQQYNRNIEDLEIWLAEVEAQLLSEDYGKDLTSVQNLQKKHALLDADINSRQVIYCCSL